MVRLRWVFIIIDKQHKKHQQPPLLVMHANEMSQVCDAEADADNVDGYNGWLQC